MRIKKERIKEEAYYMIKTKQTVREIATRFGVSKSTVHKDLKEKLKKIDLNLYKEVVEILEYHKKVRHIRGGESTKKKYLKIIDNQNKI